MQLLVFLLLRQKGSCLLRLSSVLEVCCFQIREQYSHILNECMGSESIPFYLNFCSVRLLRPETEMLEHGVAVSSKQYAASVFLHCYFWCILTMLWEPLPTTDSLFLPSSFSHITKP